MSFFLYTFLYLINPNYIKDIEKNTHDPPSASRRRSSDVHSWPSVQVISIECINHPFGFSSFFIWVEFNWCFSNTFSDTPCMIHQNIINHHIFGYTVYMVYHGVYPKIWWFHPETCTVYIPSYIYNYIYTYTHTHIYIYTVHVFQHIMTTCSIQKHPWWTQQWLPSRLEDELQIGVEGREAVMRRCALGKQQPEARLGKIHQKMALLNGKR